MLMLNWISSACIVLAGQAGPLYVNTTISMRWRNVKEFIQTRMTGHDGCTECTMHSLCRIEGCWNQLPDLLLARKWIHLVDPLLAQLFKNSQN